MRIVFCGAMRFSVMGKKHISDRLSLVLSILAGYCHRISSIRRCSWQMALLLSAVIAAAGPCHAEHTYRTKDDAIDVVLPDGWRVDDSGIKGTLALFYPDLESSKSGVSAIKLVSRRILDLTSGSATIEESVERFRERVNAENSRILEEKRKRVGGEAAHEFRLAHAQSGELEIVLVTLFRNREYTFELSAHDQQELDARTPAFEEMISRLRWWRPERVYRSADDALTVSLPLQWAVHENYKGEDRFVLIGPADGGLANVVAVSRRERNGYSLEEFVRRYVRDSANETVTRTWEIKAARVRYVIFSRIGEPPATERSRYLYDRDAYVLEFILDRFYMTGDSSSRKDLSSPELVPRDIRVMQTFIPVGDYFYIFNFNSFKESYQRYLPVVEDMLQSVRWR
jgi:hypothetical protein